MNPAKLPVLGTITITQPDESNMTPPLPALEINIIPATQEPREQEDDASIAPSSPEAVEEIETPVKTFHSRSQGGVDVLEDHEEVIVPGGDVYVDVARIEGDQLGTIPVEVDERADESMYIEQPEGMAQFMGDSDDHRVNDPDDTAVEGLVDLEEPEDMVIDVEEVGPADMVIDVDEVGPADKVIEVGEAEIEGTIIDVDEAEPAANELTIEDPTTTPYVQDVTDTAPEAADIPFTDPKKLFDGLKFWVDPTRPSRMELIKRIQVSPLTQLIHS
jgi:hypothetical protein